MQILCAKAFNDDLKGFDIFGSCIIEKGGFDYCYNHLGKEKLCDAFIRTWEIEPVDYTADANCGTWITLTQNGCKIVLAAGYYSEAEKAFYAKSAFQSLFWKGKRPEEITHQLQKTKKDYMLKKKYMNSIYFPEDL